MILEQNADQSDNLDRREGDTPKSDPDKTVEIAYTGSKIPSKAFSRLQKSMSFDGEQDFTTPGPRMYK